MEHSPKRLRILTYYDKRRHPEWMKNVDYLDALPADFARCSRSRLRPLRHVWLQFVWAWRLFRLSRNYDVVLVGSDRVGLLFSAAQRLIRRTPVPVIFIDFLISIRRDLRFKRLKKWLYRLAAEGASRVVVQRTCEINAYSQELGVPNEKFVFLPYHATVFDTAYEARASGYVFAGGDSDRDYQLLLNAARNVPLPVVIASLRKEQFRGIGIPPNVQIRSAKEREYVQLMAEAAVVVVPLKRLPQHVGGEQTYLNAMTMGKPTIVTDPDASDYIDSGRDGMLVPAGDADALREAIVRVTNDPDFARELGANAQHSAAAFTPEKFFQRIFTLCAEVAGRRSS